jgi:hypothetical protein
MKADKLGVIDVVVEPLYAPAEMICHLDGQQIRPSYVVTNGGICGHAWKYGRRGSPVGEYVGPQLIFGGVSHW